MKIIAYNKMNAVWALDMWGELVPSKIFNPPFPVLKAGHSVSYSYICHVCLEWVNSGFLPVWLVCYYAHGFHDVRLDYMYIVSCPQVTL